MDTRERLIATRRATVLNHTFVATCEIETRKQCAHDKAVEIHTRRVNFNIDMSLGRFKVVLGHHTVLIKRHPRMTHMRVWEWMKSVDKSCMLHNHYHANCVRTQKSVAIRETIALFRYAKQSMSRKTKWSVRTLLHTRLEINLDMHCSHPYPEFKKIRREVPYHPYASAEWRQQACYFAT